jgi:hypothetical protein
MFLSFPEDARWNAGSGGEVCLVQANRVRFSVGVMQSMISIAFCSQRWRSALAKTGKKRDARRKSAGIWRIRVKD